MELILKILARSLLTALIPIQPLPTVHPLAYTPTPSSTPAPSTSSKVLGAHLLRWLATCTISSKWHHRLHLSGAFGARFPCGKPAAPVNRHPAGRIPHPSCSCAGSRPSPRSHARSALFIKYILIFKLKIENKNDGGYTTYGEKRSLPSNKMFYSSKKYFKNRFRALSTSTSF